MNLEEMKLKDLLQIVKLFNGGKEEREVGPHPDLNKKVILRTYSAGVHYGKLVSKEGTEVILEGAIRLWYWDGACSLSQLAMEGTKKPSECKFAVPVDRVTLQYIEILSCTAGAIASIEGVSSWKS